MIRSYLRRATSSSLLKSTIRRCLSTSAPLVWSTRGRQVAFASRLPSSAFNATQVRFKSSKKEASGPVLQDPFPPLDTFARRHLGSNEKEVQAMLATIGENSIESLINKTVPESIRLKDGHRIQFPEQKGRPLGETEVLEELKALASQNKIYRSFIGLGYHDTITPPVILRNMIENPAWYTPYTPYQAEISQGRLESLLNFQTMISDLTALPIANASLLDEGTAAAEAMNMCLQQHRHKHSAEGDHKYVFFVANDVHPQTLAVVRTRAHYMNIDIVEGSIDSFDAAKASTNNRHFIGALVQYPNTFGEIIDYSGFVSAVHNAGGLIVAATDPLALTLLTPPGEWGADIAVGVAQRFGVPLGFGGPHAGFLSTREEFRRFIPGRLIGVSRDPTGRRALRMALQTREQHIRREKAGSNICTAQALLANVAAMYAAYHGPEGLRHIAARIHAMTKMLAAELSTNQARAAGITVETAAYFDTLRVRVAEGSDSVCARAIKKHINLRVIDKHTVGISLNETTTTADLMDLLACFGITSVSMRSLSSSDAVIPTALQRKSSYLTHPNFNTYHTEHELLRYMYRLQLRDLGLTTSMIPLGSCTMKLNATVEMVPITWPEFSRIHPFAPANQTRGYRKLFAELEAMLRAVTGFDAVSLQPNAGSQGELLGLLMIRKFHEDNGQSQRDVVLIPLSAHGTNPATASMAGMRIVVVECDRHGNVDVDDLRQKVAEHASRLAALMVTYPSTHGVFEARIREVCTIVHNAGGQVYMDGANMNAQVGLTCPAAIGADMCHLNLHKTFCIPHGGGGPGVGAVACRRHLAPYLPGNPLVPDVGGQRSVGSIAAAPWGSAMILPIPYVYMKLMGNDGLRRATEMAIVNANYMARRLEKHYRVVYRGDNGFVAHEFIIDIRPFNQKPVPNITGEDVAKRLLDYGFHAPTVSFPIANTLMIEPTESESKAELDRFCDALISIREEIREIEEGKADPVNNVLKNAPHTQDVVMADKWDRPYSREKAAFPAPWLRNHKHWPTVGRVDGVFGDRNLVCTCPPVEAYK